MELSAGSFASNARVRLLQQAPWMRKHCFSCTDVQLPPARDRPGCALRGKRCCGGAPVRETETYVSMIERAMNDSDPRRHLGMRRHTYGTLNRMLAQILSSLMVSLLHDGALNASALTSCSAADPATGSGKKHEVVFHALVSFSLVFLGLTRAAPHTCTNPGRPIGCQVHTQRGPEDARYKPREAQGGGKNRQQPGQVWTTKPHQRADTTPTPTESYGNQFVSSADLDSCLKCCCSARST